MKSIKLLLIALVITLSFCNKNNKIKTDTLISFIDAIPSIWEMIKSHIPITLPIKIKEPGPQSVGKDSESLITLLKGLPKVIELISLKNEISLSNSTFIIPCLNIITKVYENLLISINSVNQASKSKESPTGIVLQFLKVLPSVISYVQDQEIHKNSISIEDYSNKNGKLISSPEDFVKKYWPKRNN